jgi:hypothetical protein
LVRAETITVRPIIEVLKRSSIKKLVKNILHAVAGIRIENNFISSVFSNH